MEPLLILQTCDPKVYSRFLEQTGAINRSYAERHGFLYFAETSIRKGFFPWHAAFNRIYLLNEIFRSLHPPEWVLYLDADAYVADFSRDLRDFIEPHRTKALLISRGLSDRPYDVNAGVFFIQPKHPMAAFIISEWRTALERLATDEMLRNSPVPWSLPFEDQSLLQGILLGMFRRGQLAEAVQTFVGDEARSINYWGGYIRHILRRNPSVENSMIDFEQRIDVARQEKERILNGI